MKQFIYLDTDVVNSIIAQSEKGLILGMSSEREDKGEKKTTTNYGINGTGEVNGILSELIGASGKITGDVSSIKDSGESKTAKEIVSKSLHDAAYDIAYKIINPTVVSLKDQSNDEEGNYLLIKRTFYYVDFDYLKILFSNDGLIDFIKKTNEESIEKEVRKQSEVLNRETQRKSEQIIKKEIREAIAINNKQYDDISNMINIIKSIIPYDRLLISSDGYLIPLEDRYCRMNISSFGFKYGGEMTCVGMVTNIIGDDKEKMNSPFIFESIQAIVNEALKTFLPNIGNDLCVIHPIAIYYGE